jgi:hypothetical protein
LRYSLTKPSQEALGDWVNLMGHQKAAYEILTRLYTPQTITETELLRKVLLWYIRFDLFVGFQSGGESVLGREWYVVMNDYYAKKAQESPEDLNLKYEERFSYSRLVAKDSSDLFARKAKGLLSDEAFMAQLPILDEQVNNLEKNIDPVLLDPSGYVTDFPGKPDPEGIVNPYEPNVIWDGPQWTSNFLLLDTWGIIFVYNIQISMALRKPFDPALTQKAYRVCQIFEAVCAFPNGPPGAIIEAQASLAIATLFLPKDPKTIQWCRRTFAEIESAGYVYSVLESYSYQARIPNNPSPADRSILVLFHADTRLLLNLVTSTRISFAIECLEEWASNHRIGGYPMMRPVHQ